MRYDLVRISLTLIVSVFGFVWAGHASAKDGPVPFPIEPFLRLELGTHNASINRMLMAPDGEHVLTVSDDQTLRIWHAADGRADRVIRGPGGSSDEGALYALAASKRFLALGGRAGWDWDNGETFIRVLGSDTYNARGLLSGLPAPVAGATFSSDEKYFAVALFGQGRGVRVFELGKSKQAISDSDFDGEAVDVAFLSDGRLLALDSAGWLKVYDPDSGSIMGRIRVGENGDPWRLVMNNDLSRVAVTMRHKPEIAVLNAAGDGTIRTFSIPSDVGDGLANAAWSRESKYIHAVDDPRGRRLDGTLSVVQKLHTWDARTGVYIGALVIQDIGVDGTVTAMANGTGNEFYLGSNSGSWGRFRVTREGTVKPVYVVSSAVPNFQQLFDKPVYINEFGTSLVFPGSSRDGGFIHFDSKLGELSKEAHFDTEKMQTRNRGATHASLEIDPKSGEITHVGVILELDPNERALDGIVIDGTRDTIVGTNFYVRAYRNDAPLWKHPASSPVWGTILSGDKKILITFLGNGVIEWRRASNGNLLRSLFVSRKADHWVMWTPDGFFDHSAEDGTGTSGAQFVGYQINTDFRNDARFVAIDQLYKRYYRPDIVRAAIGGRPGDQDLLTEALSQIGGIAQTLESSAPPTVEVDEVCGVDDRGVAAGCGSLDIGTMTRSALSETYRAILPDTVRRSENLEVILKLHDNGGGIGPLDIRRNDILVSTEETGRIQHGNDLIVRQRISLSPGQNEVTIAAFDDDGAVASKSVRILVDGQFIRDDSKRTIHILAVGIADYKMDLFDLQENIAANDARAIAERFAATAKNSDLYAHAETKILTDADATREKIIEAIAELGRKASVRDTVILFLSGHGEVVDGDYVFAPYDLGTSSTAMIADAIEGRRFGDVAVRELFRREGLAQKTMMAELAKVPSERLLIILDTCYAGAFQTLSPDQRADRSKAVVERVSRDSGRFVLASARGLANDNDGKDYPPGLGHGLFTSTALDALTGKADYDGDKTVSLAELGGYVKAEVIKTSKDWPVPQIPVAKFLGDPYFAITDVATTPKSPKFE